MSLIKTRLLHKGDSTLFVVLASVAAFSCYFSMYAFRKPFTVGDYDTAAIGGIDFKVALILAQAMGYMLSKLWGIRFIAEMQRNRAPLSILVLIALSEAALLLFALVPPPYAVICLFLNGLPLGLIWGLVFSFLEGRRMTEILGACLAASFVVSSGVVKSVGRWVIEAQHIDVWWMPAAVGGLFALPLAISVWLLAQLPPPTPADQSARSIRQPMTRHDRRNFIKKYYKGLWPMLLFYMLLTAFRDFRDNFIYDIWRDLGYTQTMGLLTSTELIISVLVLFMVAATAFIRNNAVALWWQYGLTIGGTALIGLGTMAYESSYISSYIWMILVGLGLYIGYILFQSLIFERFFATFREKGNVGFLMYSMDTLGYLSSIGILIYKNFGASAVSWRFFFQISAKALAVSGLVLMAASCLYFYRRYTLSGTINDL